ncbi:MAG TPA: OmpH family outer membrane protein [Pirellulaceae bacterium]|nr:OmpH family outer membrane protein [Pirellulaceae bacterium]
MTRTCLLATALTLTATCLFAQSPAAPAPAVSSGTQIALIDIGYIFKHHTRYKAAREALQRKSVALRDAAGEQRKQLEAEGKKLSDYQPGSQLFKQTEAALVQHASGLQVQNELARKNLMEEEAQLYHATYLEVQTTVAQICERHGIDLVLRYDREKIDAADPDSIRRGIMNNVVYQQQQKLDITDLVLQQSSVARNTLPGPHKISPAPR